MKNMTAAAIFRAGKDLFLCQGYEKTTVREVAKRAGVNPALISYHFGSKRNLFKQVLIEQFYDLKRDFQDTIVQEDTIYGKLEAFIRVHNAHLEKNSGGYRFMVRELHFSQDIMEECLRNDLRDESDFFHTYLVTEIEHAMEAGQIRSLSPIHLLLHIISMNVFYFITGKRILARLCKVDTDIDQYEGQRVDEIVDLILCSLRPEK
ncbi:TetR/AcrR family transcriptional regulator [Chitinivibrio alkaliphilus]|uniref:TetR family transcriptional regulator n=1 Tax=Chitinivibrio alkaliphilus ACht1 TaxID=1313304 RepID=U7D7N1_9BACT|nr:TetR/AcrR family transcriptional regulator [Chitinivibrio alkaliphilus]ERP38960.1 TetR family transcriptional regulator [Chitinivibrio alkaliphilus ACht1]